MDNLIMTLKILVYIFCFKSGSLYKSNAIFMSNHLNSHFYQILKTAISIDRMLYVLYNEKYKQQFWSINPLSL